MASVERYLKAFIKVIPQRSRHFNGVQKLKEEIDQQFFGDSFINYKTIQELKKLIGEDTLFRAAEKRDKQTLRHYLWKLSKSFQFFEKNNGKIKRKMESSKIFKNMPQLESVHLKCGVLTSEFRRYVEKLDDIYIKEIKALKSKEFKEYFESVKLEREYVKQINSKSSDVKNIQKTLGNLAKSIIKEWSHSWSEDRVNLAWDILFLLVVVFVMTVILGDYRKPGKDLQNFVLLLMGQSYIISARTVLVISTIKDFIKETI